MIEYRRNKFGGIFAIKDGKIMRQKKQLERVKRKVYDKPSLINDLNKKGLKAEYDLEQNVDITINGRKYKHKVEYLNYNDNLYARLGKRIKKGR